jgi:hypothetical protein
MYWSVMFPAIRFSGNFSLLSIEIYPVAGVISVRMVYIFSKFGEPVFEHILFCENVSPFLLLDVQIDGLKKAIPQSMNKQMYFKAIQAIYKKSKGKIKRFKLDVSGDQDIVNPPGEAAQQLPIKN